MATTDRRIVPTADSALVAKADLVFAELQVVVRRLERVQGLVEEAAVQDAAGSWLDADVSCAVARQAVEDALSAVPELALVGNGDPRYLLVGELRIDVHSHRAWFGGVELELARQEFRLLASLAGAPTKVWSKQELLREVWGFRASGRTRTVDSHASRTRRKLLAAGAQEGEWIVNVWSVGYALRRSS